MNMPLIGGAVLSAAILFSCRSGDPSARSARTTEAGVHPEARPGWDIIPVDYPIFYVGPRTGVRGGSVALAVRAPPGTRMYEDTAALLAPNDMVVLMSPDERWEGDPRPIAERTFVTADCAHRRADWGQPLAPWDGRVVQRLRTAAGDAVTICRGTEPERPGDCYLVSSYLVAAKLECGGGSSCLGQQAATITAEICASVRRR